MHSLKNTIKTQKRVFFRIFDHFKYVILLNTLEF